MYRMEKYNAHGWSDSSTTSVYSAKGVAKKIVKREKDMVDGPGWILKRLESEKEVILQLWSTSGKTFVRM